MELSQEKKDNFKNTLLYFDGKINDFKSYTLRMTLRCAKHWPYFSGQEYEKWGEWVIGVIKQIKKSISINSTQEEIDEKFEDIDIISTFGGCMEYCRKFDRKWLAVKNPCWRGYWDLVHTEKLLNRIDKYLNIGKGGNSK